jgi:ABC-type sugar transport system ATPase subunit
MTPLLTCKNIGFAWQRQPVFHRFCCTVLPGERLVIEGPSGSGKSTLLRLIAGLETPHTGEIEINGRLASGADRIIIKPADRGIGMVFQDLALWPHMCAYDNIAFPLVAAKTDPKTRSERIKTIARRVGIDFPLDRRPHTLSMGQRQRVALARALVAAPKLLLMDEPFASLDEPLALRLCNEIVHLQKEMGFTLLFVTHRHEERRRVGTRVLQLDSQK